MGNTYEVWSWYQDSDGSWNYVQKYSGESCFKAIYRMIALKVRGVGCVKFEWR